MIRIDGDQSGGEIDLDPRDLVEFGESPETAATQWLRVIPLTVRVVVLLGLVLMGPLAW